MHKKILPQPSIHDSYWTARLEVNSSRAIYHQWEQLEASGCIDNFRIVTGEIDSFREGWFFADSDAYKWLEAAARIYASEPDSALATLMDGLISLINRAQDPDGYIFTYNQIHFPGTRWINLMIEHELYCHGHLIEAGVSHYLATNETSLLEITRKAANRIVEDFVGKGPEYTPGHEEIEVALLRLYQVTDYQPYLDLARQFLEQRGKGSRVRYTLSQITQLRSVASRRSSIRKQREDFQAQHPGFYPKKLPPNNFAKTSPTSYLRWLVSDLNGKYLQQHSPIRKQTIPVGHSVRFGYLETAIAILHRLEGDITLLTAMEQAWESMVSRRMYVTGGIGSVPGLEGFGNDYELDPEYAYTETCAALACMFWSWEMALITGEAKYSDLFEWQLYNAAAVGMGIDGTSYLYNNPLACRGGITRKPWYAVPCCPSNLSRTWANLGKYIYSSDENAIWVHQYISSHADFQSVGKVRIEVEASMPWNGNTRLKVELPKPAPFTLHLRIPSWVSSPQDFSAVKLNGFQLSTNVLHSPSLPYRSAPTAQGYDPRLSRFLSIQRDWSSGDLIEIDFDMPILLRRAHPKVKGHQNRVAVTRGPLVYCLESNDNPGVDIFTSRLNLSSLETEPAPNLLGGITLLRGTSLDGQPLIFIPYHLWANRGESQMNVWILT
jgi:hypothetical protein